MVEALNTHQEQTPEDPSYVQEMVQKAEGLNNQQEERPEWLPEKFNSPKDMAEAYANLERQFHDKQGDTDEAGAVDEMGNEEVKEYLSDKGIDFNTMSEDFWQNDGLSEDQYNQLEAAGIPSDIVDQFIDGQKAIVDATRQQAFNIAGGEENYGQMMDWATNNLSEPEQDAFNAAVDSGDTGKAMFAIQGLSARFRSDAGSEPNLVQGEVSNSSVGSYQSLAEITSAMSDPRYEKDPAYRDQVAKKLQRSSVL
jgi:hypothetical protein